MAEEKPEPGSDGGAARRRRWFWGILIGALVIGFLPAVLVVAVFFFSYSARAHEAKERNEANRRATASVVAALARYRAAHGRYPHSLRELYPADLSALPRLSPGARLEFAARPDGTRCWLAIDPYDVGTAIMPSDLVDQYDCGTGAWEVLDVTEAKAGPDPEWQRLLEGASPGPSP